MARKIKTRTKKNRVNRNIIGKVVYYFALFSFIGVIIYVIFFSHRLAITNIEISGEKNVSQEDIQNKIKAELEGKYLGIVDKNNLALIRTNRIEDELTRDFEKIKSVSIKRKFPSGLIVNVEERKIALIVCSADRCFVTDEDGQAFEETTPDSSDYQNNDWLILKDMSGIAINKGEYALNPSLIQFLATAIDNLKNSMELAPEREVETPNRVSYDLRLKLNDGCSVYFNGNLDLKKQMEILKTVLEDKIGKDNLSNVEYIDLRSDNKVFYKFKDGVEQDESNSENQSTDTINTGQQPKSDKKEKKKV